MFNKIKKAIKKAMKPVIKPLLLRIRLIIKEELHDFYYHNIIEAKCTAAELIDEIDGIQLNSETDARDHSIGINTVVQRGEVTLQELVQLQNEADEYALSVCKQIDQYKNVENMHELPEIFHYWSTSYLRPKVFDVFDIKPPFSLYLKVAIQASQLQKGESATSLSILSLGSGYATEEIRLANLLKKKNIDFSLECMELSPILCQRARQSVEEQGLGNVSVTECDLNKSELPSKKFDLIMANHSLHHILDLEHVFEQISLSLKPTGYFATCDMIGRNGHMRWDEVLKWVNTFWGILDESKKYNHQLKRLEEQYDNWDCSIEGFEGIRAQDILPLLIRKFDFVSFLGYGGVIDPFIERNFGHNYSVDNVEDTRFIDTLEFLNDYLLETGVIKPTMMWAVMKNKSINPPECKFYKNLSPEFCVRLCD